MGPCTCLCPSPQDVPLPHVLPAEAPCHGLRIRLAIHLQASVECSCLVFVSRQLLVSACSNPVQPGCLHCPVFGSFANSGLNFTAGVNCDSCKDPC